MKCSYKISKNKKIKPCNKECVYKFCFPHWKEKIKKSYKIIAFIIATISGFFIWYGNYQTVKDEFKTEHEKFIEQNYISQIIAPPAIDNKIIISSGNAGSFSADITKKELNATSIGIGCIGDDGYGKEAFDKGESFTIKLVDNKLLISFIIRDIKTEEIICEVVDNVWRVRKNIKDFYSDSKSLEIIDPYGFPAFSLWVDDNSVVQYRGYFVGQVCASFNNGIVQQFVDKTDKNYFKKCFKLAAELKPQFIK